MLTLKQKYIFVALFFFNCGEADRDAVGTVLK
jgi:hypothetical protein